MTLACYGALEIVGVIIIIIIIRSAEARIMHWPNAIPQATFWRWLTD